jgi:hypothetical protein
MTDDLTFCGGNPLKSKSSREIKCYEKA